MVCPGGPLNPQIVTVPRGGVETMDSIEKNWASQVKGDRKTDNVGEKNFCLHRCANPGTSQVANENKFGSRAKNPR